MNRSSTRLVLALAGGATVLLAGCASTTGGSGRLASGAASGFPSSSAPSSAAPTSSVPSSAAPTTSTPTSGGTAGSYPTDTTGLATLLEHGLASIKTAHLSMTVVTNGQTIVAQGDQTIENGKTKDAQLSESLPGLGTLKIVIVGGKTYVQLPPAQRTSAKPWSLVTPSSNNPTVKVLSSSLSSTASLSGVNAAGLFVTAGDNLRLKGIETVDSTPVAHYTLDVVVAKLPASYPQKSTLEQVGLDKLPIELFVDQQGRTRQVLENITVQGVTADTKVQLSKFDVPVTVTAPPASEVSTTD